MRPRTYAKHTCLCGSKRIRANFMMCKGCSESICNVCWHGTCPHCGKNISKEHLVKEAEQIAADRDEGADDEDLFFDHCQSIESCYRAKVDIPGWDRDAIRAWWLRMGYQPKGVNLS